MAYISNEEMKEIERLLEKDSVLSDTLSCWVATRINGASASMACDGNICLPLLKAFDHVFGTHLPEGKDMNKYHALQEEVRKIPLNKRLEMCQEMISKMCSEGRPPKMSIPVRAEDEDFFINTTLQDALTKITE